MHTLTVLRRWSADHLERGSGKRRYSSYLNMKDFGKRKFISLSSEKQRVQSAKDTQNNMRSRK
uniref:Uncharacterized protein n=1 Tax=Octopus bimaculoides TaxID=37653 RepID=A0A0L8GBZ1_OCTBM